MHPAYIREKRRPKLDDRPAWRRQAFKRYRLNVYTNNVVWVATAPGGDGGSSGIPARRHLRRLRAGHLGQFWFDILRRRPLLDSGSSPQRRRQQLCPLAHRLPSHLQHRFVPRYHRLRRSSSPSRHTLCGSVARVRRRRVCKTRGCMATRDRAPGTAARA